MQKEKDNYTELVVNIYGSINSKYVMLKTIVIPKDKNICLSIPNSYVGKEIEILLYSREELEEEKSAPPPKKTWADFIGILSDSDYQSLKAHVEQARKEWDRNI